MIKELTMQAVSEKMPSLLNDIQKEKLSNIFKPVDTKPAEDQQSQAAATQ